ncbi:MAG: hypothetical protein DRJ38_03340 [Thermoprotei archaeon]|nr:MAG: hypothetical protein DRJ38_03340 [Thermoprotei archaeon]
MKLGITSYAYRWAIGTKNFRPKEPLNVFGLLDKVSSHGLEVLQICENINLDMTIEDYERLGEAAKRKGIIIELGTNKMNRSTLSKYVQIAELIDSHLLRVYPQKKETIQRLVKRLRDFLPELRDRDITLAIENSSLGIYNSYELVEIFKQVNDPLVGACIDVANSLILLEKPFETVKILAPYAKSLHLKDFCIKRASEGGGFIISGVPLGEGMLNVKAIIDIIRNSGCNPNILIEQWMERKSDEEETLKEEERWLKKSIRFLRSILAELDE